MTSVAAIAVAAAIAYLIGSIPFGLLVARLAGGIDIRRAGSGNIGATNVARTLGGKLGALVLLLDVLKGFLPTAFLPDLLLSRSGAAFPHLAPHLAAASGISAILGHMFPCWLKFRGGKGVATALGVIIALNWQATIVTAIVFLVAFGAWRIVSLASILATLSFGACQLFLLRSDAFSARNWSLAAFSIAAPLLIVVRHRANIGRLLRGEEPKFRAKKAEHPPNGTSSTDVGNSLEPEGLKHASPGQRPGNDARDEKGKP